MSPCAARQVAEPVRNEEATVARPAIA
jgi:hypothetical protein